MLTDERGSTTANIANVEPPCSLAGDFSFIFLRSLWQICGSLMYLISEHSMD